MADNQKKSNEEIKARLAKALGDDYEIFECVINQLSKESDRGSVIVGAAWLERELKALVEQALPDDKDVGDVFTKPRRSLGYHIGIAYELRLICLYEKKMLDLVNKIRIEFAHKILASFDDSEVKELIPKLEPFISLESKPTEDPRDYYVHAVALLHAYLNVRVSSAREITDMTKRLDKMRWLAERHGEELEGER
jgi:hypothetical protein